MPPSALAAAERLGVQLLALVERARDRKELAPSDLIARLQRVVDFAERVGLDDRAHVARPEVRWRYKTTLPYVRAWKEHLLLADAAAAVDVGALLKNHKMARDFAEDVGFTWTPRVCKDLVDSKPSAWLIDMLAKRYRRSPATIRDRLHRKSQRHA